MDITLYDIKADINEVSISSLQQLILKANQKTSGTQNTTSNTPSIKFTMSVNMSNASIIVSYMGFESIIGNINAQAEFNENLSFDSATINIPYINALYTALSSNVSLEDIRASIDKDFVLSASIEKTSYNDKLKRAVYLENLSCIAKYQKENANIALYAQTATTFYNDYKALINGATLFLILAMRIRMAQMYQ